MDTVIAKTEERMGKAVASMEHDYAQIRAGRANPGVLDNPARLHH